MEKLTRSKDKMTIGLPSKGRPKEHVVRYLAERGYAVPADGGRRLQTTFVDKPNHRIAFFHAKDIPVLVAQGHLDAGFTGLDLLHETKAKVRPIIKLNLGKVKMVIAVQKNSAISHPFHLLHRQIATPFPIIAQEYFHTLRVPVTIRPIFGTSEGMAYCSCVDAIIDVSETGKTLEENELKVIADDVFDSELVLIVNKPEHFSNHQLVHDFLRSLYD